MPRVTVDDLLAAIATHSQRIERKPSGLGWATLEELAKRARITRLAMKYRIKRARAQGLRVDMQHGSHVKADGRVVRTAYYRLR